jgi:hypothetical protein
VTPRYLSITVTVAAVLAATLLPQPAAAQPAPGGPAFTVDPAELDTAQAPGERVTHELTLGNGGDADLDWEVAEPIDDPQRLPRHPTTPVATVDVPDPGGSASLERFPGHAGRPGWTVAPAVPPAPDGQLTFTHSRSQSVVAGSGAACARNRGTITAATSYLRHFTLSDFDITGELAVTSVSFGVESLRGAAQTVTVNLHTMADPGGPFRYDNFDPIGSAEVTLRPQTMSIVEVPVTGTAPAGSTLVVEVAAPDLRRGSFYPGANPDGQAAPSYLASAACGLPEPAPTAALGFPDLQFLLDVTGVAAVPACDTPTGTPWAAVDPLAGAVAPGGTQPVEVSFDSTGHEVGDVLAGQLCLVSNDPDRRLAVVPLTMRVVAPPAVVVSPDSLAAEQWGGTITEQPLTIGNPGGLPLEWTVEPTAGQCDAPAGVGWLAVSPGSGATAAGEDSELTVSFDATGLAAGAHTAALCVESNDPATRLVEVPVTLTVTVPCDQVIDGVHPEPLTVTTGLTCLAPGAQVQGALNVLDGAGLVAESAVVQGPLATFGATRVELTASLFTGPMSIRGTTGTVSMAGNQVVGSVLVVDNRTGQTPIVVSDNWIVGSLFCTGNRPAPVDRGAPNTVVGGMKLDQCATL